MSDTDISLAVQVDNLTLFESVFHTEKPAGENAQTRMAISNPDNRFDLDLKARRTVLRATVGVQFGIYDEDSDAAARQGEDVPTPLLFNVLVGVVVSTPFMGEAAPQARHLAGAEATDTAQRDKHMEQAMRVEAIKAGYAFAQTKLAEASALSPLGTIMLPLIDADEILVDIERQENPQE